MRIASAILFLAAASGDALAASGGGAIRAIAVEGNDIWAVGDAGALIHSPDGGTTWQEPNAPTAANFQAVRVQGHTVFVFGGSALAGHPDGAGVGTIARSDDDGKSFLPISTGDAGWLYGGFYAGSTAVVFGQATPNARGGIWRSVAEGRWHPLAGETAGHLLGGVFPRRDLGYVVGVNQRILSVRDLEQSRHHPPPDASPFTLRAAALETQEPHRCWCVGEEGLVLRSPPGLAVTQPAEGDVQGSAPWQSVRMPLPAGTRRLGDFEAVALALGGNLWIAGGLLGVIPHSADGGVTWKLQPAPAGGGIHALVAIDANTLLAGGDGGRIWRSGDAGATWQLLRGRGQTDVLFILAPGDTGPYPAIAAHGRAGLNVAVLYAASPAGEGYPSDQPLRAAAAAAGAAGVCVLGDFASLAGLAPLQPPTEAQVLRAWSASLDSPAERELLRQLTAAIRLYRPAVLAVGPSGPGSLGEKAQSRLIARVALKAADEAADTSAAPELVAVGLNPWKVERIFVGDEENDRCAAPWEPAAPPKATPQASGGAPPTATVLIDSGAIPEGAAGPLELLAQDAIWRLPWAGLLDRPAHITAYTCAGLTGTPRLFTTALAGPHALATSAPTPQQRKLISSAGLRLAAAANRTAPLVQELAAVMENPDSPPTALLAADRMLLVRARLLAEGKFAQADEALTLFLKHGQGHPLYSQVNVETLALSASSLWKGQLARMGMPPSSQAADLPKALKSFGDWSLWSESPWGAMVYAAALARTGRAVESPAIWRRMINGPYAPGWRRAANLELSLATRGALDAEGRNVAAAAFTAERGTIDGRLNEPIWQDARVYRLATSPTGAAASEPAAAALTPSFQILRTPTHVVAAIRLPAAPRRQWQFSWAVDSGRDGWTQFVITADTAGHRRAEILSRLGPPATCEDGSYMIGGQSSPDEFTFELAVAIADLGADPAVGGVWNFQLRADATDSDSPQTFFFQPQADGATEPQRYGLLVVPPPGR